MEKEVPLRDRVKPLIGGQIFLPPLPLSFLKVSFREGAFELSF